MSETVTEFKQYQRLAKTTAMYPRDGISGVDYVALGLCEAGEVQNQLKKAIRDDNGVVTEERRAAVAKELGDLLWYVAMTCEELGLELEDVAQGNVTKLFSRKERGVIKGSGDNR